MLVQRVLMPGSGRESWTLLGDDGEVVEPAERYLACLSAIERSPDTVRACAVSLKLWFEFLQHAAVNWGEAGAEDVARFAGWLRAPAGNVIVLADGNFSISATGGDVSLSDTFFESFNGDLSVEAPDLAASP